MKKTTNLQTVVLIVIVNILFVGLLTFILRNQINQQGDLKTSIKTEQQRMDQNRQEIMSLIRIKDSLAKTEEKVTAYEQLMPEETSDNTLLEYLQEAAAEVNGRIYNVSFDTITDKKGYTEIPLKVSFTGKYPDLLTFLDTVQYGERLISVDGIYIESTGEAAAIAADISMRAFYRNNMTTDAAVSRSDSNAAGTAANNPGNNAANSTTNNGSDNIPASTTKSAN